MEICYTSAMPSQNLSRDLLGAGFSFRGTDVRYFAFATCLFFTLSVFAFADIVFHCPAVCFMSQV